MLSQKFRRADELDVFHSAETLEGRLQRLLADGPVQVFHAELGQESR